MSRVLAFDTCTHACSVALKVNDEVFSYHEIIPQQHAHELLPIIQSLLQEAELTLADLDLLAVGSGPGAFTGVRIGVSTAQGLAYSADTPVVGVSTLACLAQHAADEFDVNQLFVAVDARMDEVYTACYRRNTDSGLVNIEGLEQVLNPAQIDFPKDAEWTGVGSGWDIYSATLLPRYKGIVDNVYADVLPNAKALIKLAEHKLLTQGVTTPAELQPVYLRDQVAKPKR